jgi:hypothetical protein
MNRMRALFCAAIFVSWLVPARSETRTPASSVTIVYRFDGPAPGFVLQEIKDEVRILMEPSAVRPNWRDRAGLTSSESFENLVVVDFHGRCRTGPGDSVSRDDQPLGRAQVVDGQVLPFVEVECGRVQRFLRTTLTGGREQNADVVLGRALGRVLAHELYHVLASTTLHSRNGIAKPELSGTDLSSLRFEFAPADLDRMKSPTEQPLAGHASGALGFVP